MHVAHIEKKEWRLAAVFSLLIAFLTFLPYGIGVFGGEKGYVFMGTPIVAPADYRSYLAWIDQARHGALLFYNYSAPLSLSTTGVLFHPIFLTLGVVGRLTGLSSVLLYHLATSFAAGVLCLISYRFFATFTTSLTQRRCAILLFICATGVGAFLYGTPSGFDLPEFSMFIRMNNYLLGSIDAIITLTAFLVVLEGDRPLSRKDGILIGLLLGFLSLVHPYMVVVSYATIMLYVFYRDRSTSKFHWYPLALAFIMLLPCVLWQALALAKDPSFAMWFFLDMHTERYRLVELIVGYGLILPLSLYGLYITGRELLRGKQALLFIWMLVMLCGMYQPLFPGVARRLGEGLLAPLAFYGSAALAVILQRKPGRALMLFSLPLLLWGNIMYAVAQSESYKEGPTRPSMEEVSPDALSVMAWLDDHTTERSVIFSAGGFGSVIPAFVNARVMFGHPSLMPSEKSQVYTTLQLLTASSTDTSAWNLFMKDIDYIVVDDELRSYGFQKQAGENLEEVFHSGSITVLRVLHS